MKAIKITYPFTLMAISFHINHNTSHFSTHGNKQVRKTTGQDISHVTQLMEKLNDRDSIGKYKNLEYSIEQKKNR